VGYHKEKADSPDMPYLAALYHPQHPLCLPGDAEWLECIFTYKKYLFEQERTNQELKMNEWNKLN